MATHRRPKQPSRARMSVLTAAAATAVAISAQAAYAAPKPTKDSVKAQVDKLNQQAEQATEQYDGAMEKQKELQKQVGNLQDEVARQQASVSRLQDSLGALAASQYRSGGIDPTVQLMLSAHPDDFLDRASSLDRLSAQQSDSLKQLQVEQRKLDQEKAEAQAKLAELDSTAKELRANKRDVQAKLAKAQALLNSLTAQERAALQAQEQAAAARAAQEASRSSARLDLSGIPAGSHAAAAIEAAKSALGSPYVYGADGPSTFDCSGLMQWSYAKAGVSLPRTSQEQAYAGTYVGTSLSNAKPGDLIIYYSDMHHVGMYVGGGQIIHAPHTGAVVRYESASEMPIARIVRPS